MPLPEFIGPALSVVSPAALVLVIMRCFPLVARAVVVLLAGVAAIVTTSRERRAACIKVLSLLSRQSESEPAEPLAEPVEHQGGTRHPDRRAPRLRHDAGSGQQGEEGKPVVAVETAGGCLDSVAHDGSLPRIEDR